MTVLCPDAMVLVSIINKERGCEKCKKKLREAHEVLLFQCVLVEVAKVCARQYVESSMALYSGRVRQRVLEKYREDSVLHQLMSRNEYSNQLEELDRLLNELPSTISKLILCTHMKVFPNPFGANCSFLEVPKERSKEIKSFIAEILRLPISPNVKWKLEGYLEKYGLEEYAEEVEKSLTPELWKKIESDRYTLATYSKAKEFCPSLEILTRDIWLYSVGLARPDKFSVHYFSK